MKGIEPNTVDKYQTGTLSKRDFGILRDFIQSNFGIKMPDIKRGMVESRLRKRLISLGMESYSDYCEYLFSERGMASEVSEFVDAITTNKTDFFREPQHFEFLFEKALPDLMIARKGNAKKHVMVWSCACSRGDEPYTLSMVLSEFGRITRGFDFSILATDISRRVLIKAVEAIYDEQTIEPVPIEYRKRYLLKSRDKTKQLVRIKPELRRKIVFRRLNLMDDDFKLLQKVDVLFCRNVVIYFDKSTTRSLMERLCERIHPGGYLFMGHSELLDCSNLPMTNIAPSIYQKIG